MRQFRCKREGRLYDIIGDIHGERATLESLLKELDYTHDLSGYRHPNRKESGPRA